MRTDFTFSIPTKLYFGAGRLNRLHEVIMQGKKALIVTTSGKSVKKYGYLERLEKELSLSSIDYVLYDRVSANPTLDNVMEGASIARDNNCDMVIALGGGSAMDCSKAIALSAVNPGDFWDYVYAKTGKGKAFKNVPLPVVCITTTAGTGSEIDPWFVITKTETNEKAGSGWVPYSYPAVSIVDPELMISVPANMTAYQGFDALFHATESVISRQEDVFAEMFALQAVEYIGTYLARAVNDGSDLEARTFTALANTLAGFYMNCTSEHSLEHELSAFHPEMPHGAGLIMISDAYYRAMVEKHACDEQLIKLARALGAKDASDPADFLTALQALKENCHVADLQMSSFGVLPEELPEMVRNARLMGGLFGADPTVLSDDELLGIYRRSYK